MMKINSKLLAGHGAACVCALALVVCGLSASAAPVATLNASTPANRFQAQGLSEFFTSVLPPAAVEIPAAMASAKAGDTVTLHGYVALSKDAFGAKQSVFVLVDERLRTGKIPSAKSLPATAADIPAEGRLTVQLLGKDGKPLRENLNGELGLKPGAEVFVTGVVESANGKDAMVVNATLLHVPRGSLPAAFFVNKAPGTVRDVTEARTAGGMKAGDEVVLRGRIGGSKEPFVAGRAVFTLMGRGLKACNENPDDACKAPWDYCCETQAAIMANSVTVQVVDDKGRILRTDMKGRKDLKELSEVVVIGKVASINGDAVLVTAIGIEVAN